MGYLFLITGLMAVIVSVMPVVTAVRFVRRINADLKKSTGQFFPGASLIVPCKGLDFEFEKNIQALFDQDYPDFEIIFVTDRENDPAFARLLKLMKANPHVRSRLATAGRNEGRSQKINNQLKGVSMVDPDTEILVFADSDIRPGPLFMKHLVQPLADRSVGLATGYRWYVPQKGGLWSVLRSAWNGGGLVFLTDPRANYAWGGAMAITRNNFEKCRVNDAWQNALTDDFSMCRAVGDCGLKTQFVPRCLVATHEDCSFAEMLEWTNRQTVITRVYHPRLWKKIAITHGLGNSALLLGISLLFISISGISSDPLITFSALLMLTIAPMEMAGAVVLKPAVGKMLPGHKSRLRRLSWKYLVLAPAASMLGLANIVYSIFTRRITWRGTTYEMLSTTSTVIIKKR